MKKKILKRKVSDAPESNAGDNFHVLWVIKKSLGLINFNDEGLKAITLEGINPQNALQIDPTGSELLGVDIVEYFGGDDSMNASQIIISQLKYSTRRAGENWTFSKLSKGKKSGSSDGSVMHRLAQIFKKFLDAYCKIHSD